MAFWNRNRKAPEERSGIEDPSVPISSEAIIDFLNVSGGLSASGVTVTIEKAMGVPAIWAAVNFIRALWRACP